jgi:aminoglycoside phosphotransferase (APT) family kinase protein
MEYLADRTGEVLGSPGLALERVEGTTDVEPADLPDALDRMAGCLAGIHALDLDILAGLSLPPREDPVEGTLLYLPDQPEPAETRAALEARGRLEPRNAPTLLHGDFWPGNLLWRDGAVAAVLDWEDAAIGDPLCHLAGARVELTWKHGEAAAEAFTEAYGRRVAFDPSDLPLWALHATSAGVARMGEWGLPARIERRMRERTARFIARASAELRARLPGRRR